MHETVVSPAAAHCALPSSPFPHCSNKVKYSTTDGDLSDSFNVLTMLTAHVPSIQSHPSESPPRVARSLVRFLRALAHRHRNLHQPVYTQQSLRRV